MSCRNKALAWSKQEAAPFPLPGLLPEEFVPLRVQGDRRALFSLFASVWARKPVGLCYRAETHCRNNDPKRKMKMPDLRRLVRKCTDENFVVWVCIFFLASGISLVKP